ncbi:flagellin, partial [Candidatus Riflebacteria bacterium]
MGLRINHNVSALVSHRALANVDARLSKNLERLSTGLRVNVAADDAAGLTISEKLRTQVRGLNRASFNIQDGISLIQTAEGALDQTQSMLQRMRELAIQAGNDTLTTSDRLEIQKEVEQLKDQIDLIAHTTEFNTKKLLDGTSTAVISSSAPSYLDGIAVGSLATFGDYSVAISASGENNGRAQRQRSNIYTKTDGTLADKTTTLESIAQFTDHVGHFILDAPQELYLIADNVQSHFTVSKDLTLQQLADRMSIAINEGLGIENSTTKVTTIDDTTQSSIEVKSGKVGKIGDINFTGQEDLIKALGFELVQSSVDAIYTVKATQLEQSVVNTVSSKIGGNRVKNLIQGLELVFEPGLAACISSSILATHGISIDSTDNLEFHVADTDGTSIGLVLYNNTATVTVNGSAITLPSTASKGRYSAAQIVSFFNQAASTNYTDNTATAHHFLATRVPSTVNSSIAFGAPASQSFHYGFGPVSFTVGDGTGGTTIVSLTAQYNSAASIATVINSSLLGAGVLVSATSNGDRLRFYQKSGGTRVSLINIAGAGQNDTTMDANNLRKIGFSFAGALLSTANSFIESSFTMQAFDFSSIAGGVKGPISFGVSQAGVGQANIVINENVGSIGGLVSAINTQLVAFNSGVRARTTASVLQFYSASGPERFAIKDLGAAGTGFFTGTRDMTRLHFTDGTDTVSNVPTVSETPLGGNGTYSIRAALRADGNISFYHLTELGSASRIEVDVRSGGVTNKLGLVSGRSTGTGGLEAIAVPSTNVSTVTFGGGSIVLNVYDQHYDQANGDNFARISFSGGTTYNTTVIRNVFNQQLAQQDS